MFPFFLITLEERRIGTHDKDMVEEIHRISKKYRYETVVVSCGNSHLKSLPDLLEEKG